MIGLDGVDANLAWAVQALDDALNSAAPGLGVVVTSGYRSPARQRELRSQWDRGDRAGLTSRPADSSRHTSGRAVDLAFRYQGRTVPVHLTPRSYFQAAADFMAPAGVRWGGYWRTPSPNHFEI